MTVPSLKKADGKIPLLTRVVFWFLENSLLNSTDMKAALENNGGMIGPVTRENTLLMRNLGYSGAATCLILMLAVLQIGAASIFLKISLTAAAGGLPIWLISGLIYESYLSLNSSLYPHQRTKFATKILAPLQIIAALSLMVSLFSILYYVWPVAAWVFLIGVVISIFLFLIFFFSIIFYWLVQWLKDLFKIDILERVQAAKTHKRDVSE